MTMTKIINALTAPVWRTITLGTHKTGQEYRSAFGSQVDGLGIETLRGREFHTTNGVPVKLSLAKVSMEEIGCTKEHLDNMADGYALAIQGGFGICPPEAAPVLCLPQGKKYQAAEDNWVMMHHPIATEPDNLVSRDWGPLHVFTTLNWKGTCFLSARPWRSGLKKTDKLVVVCR